MSLSSDQLMIQPFQSFCKKIRTVILRGYVLRCEQSPNQILHNTVNVDVDMHVHCVKHFIICDYDQSFVVTHKSDSYLHSFLLQGSFEPKYLASCFGECKVFFFCDWCGYSPSVFGSTRYCAIINEAPMSRESVVIRGVCPLIYRVEFSSSYIIVSKSWINQVAVGDFVVVQRNSLRSMEYCCLAFETNGLW